MLIATVPYVGQQLHLDPDPEPDPELITDPDPDMQIISDPAGSGYTTLFTREDLLFTVSAGYTYCAHCSTSRDEERILKFPASGVIPMHTH